MKPFPFNSITKSRLTGPRGSLRLSLLALLSLLLFSCKKELYPSSTVTVPGTFPVNAQHPMKDSLVQLVQKHIARGIPGMQVIVKNNDGWFLVNGGYASLENRQPFTDNLSTWVYSISKTYMAAIVLRLQEQSLLKLDTTVSAYLPASLLSRLANGPRITVRQLLNHSSGLRNHTTEPAYQLAQLNDPLRQPDLAGKLRFIYDKPALFAPGTDFAYTNSGYTLLQWIVEKVSGKSYEQVLREELLQPLGLARTWYNIGEAERTALGAPNYYFERYNNGVLENCTRWHNSIAEGLEGYGGIIAHGSDVIRFYEALFTGRVLNAASLAQMRTWITGSKSDEPDYGLGLEYYGKYNKRVPTVTYGHEGDGLGGTTQLLYVPVNNTYLFITINAGRQIFGQYLIKTSDAKIDLCRYVAEYR